MTGVIALRDQDGLVSTAQGIGSTLDSSMAGSSMVITRGREYGADDRTW